jgi:transposase InsO family protein
LIHEELGRIEYQGE